MIFVGTLDGKIIEKKPLQLQRAKKSILIEWDFFALFFTLNN